MSHLSFHEKSAWGTLIALWIIGACYFRSAWQLWSAGELDPGSNLGLAAGLTVLLVLVLVVYHVLVAIITRREPDDERDRLIAWRAGKLGGLILGFGVIGIVLQILVGGQLGDALGTTPVLIANALLGVVFVATTVELVMTLIYYRRGV